MGSVPTRFVVEDQQCGGLGAGEILLLTAGFGVLVSCGTVDFLERDDKEYDYDSLLYKAVINDREEVTCIAWSPDGKSIAFVSDRSEDPDLHWGTDIWVVNVDEDGHELTQITSNEGRDYSPAWSLDGRSIAYVTSTGYDIGGSALTPTRYLAVTRVGHDERRILPSRIISLEKSANFVCQLPVLEHRIVGSSPAGTPSRNCPRLCPLKLFSFHR